MSSVHFGMLVGTLGTNLSQVSLRPSNKHLTLCYFAGHLLLLSMCYLLFILLLLFSICLINSFETKSRAVIYHHLDHTEHLFRGQNKEIS